MSESDKRKYERVIVSIPAKFSVLIPEHTFRPVDYDCEVLDISERGAMINVRLSPDNYGAMLQKTRYCRLEFYDEANLPDKVTGRAVWLQPQGKEDERIYRIGLFFEDCPAEIVSGLRRFVDKIKTSQVNSST